MHSSVAEQRRIADAIRRTTLCVKAARVELALAELHELLTKANFNPDQPRVPAGSPDGGQWTDDARWTGGGLHRSLSDTSVGIAHTGPQYAATEISIGPNALTGISNIDETTVKLAKTLAGVVDTIGVVPGIDPAKYGRTVHTAFALTVRLAGFRGIGFFDVETTFNLDIDIRYGAKGSARTDVILRNDAGEIIAIYDVKTGGAKLEPRRIRELRAKTGVGPNVPIIELHVLRGVSLKRARSSRVAWFHCPTPLV